MGLMETSRTKEPKQGMPLIPSAILLLRRQPTVAACAKITPPFFVNMQFSKRAEDPRAPKPTSRSKLSIERAPLIPNDNSLPLTTYWCTLHRNDAPVLLDIHFVIAAEDSCPPTPTRHNVLPILNQNELCSNPLDSR